MVLDGKHTIQVRCKESRLIYNHYSFSQYFKILQKDIINLINPSNFTNYGSFITINKREQMAGKKHIVKTAIIIMILFFQAGSCLAGCLNVFKGEKKQVLRFSGGTAHIPRMKEAV